MVNQRKINRSSNMLFLKISGVLKPDNSLILKPIYPSNNARGSMNIKESPLQIEFYENKRLLLRWGASIAVSNFKENIQKQANIKKEYFFAGKSRRVCSTVPFPQGTNKIIFRNDDIEIAEINVPINGPYFEKHVKIQSSKNCYKLYWEAKHPDNLPIFYNVRTSSDGGETWRRLSSQITKNEVEILKNDLVGAENCIVEVVAYDGFHNATSQIKVTETPPIQLSVSIMSPTTSKIPIIPPVKLCSFTQCLGKMQPAEKDVKYTWFANGNKIGEGPRTTWLNPKPGEYEISLNAGSGKMKAHDSIRIKIDKSLQ